MLTRQSQLDQNRCRLLSLESQLRQRKLIYKPQVQVQLSVAHYATSEIVFHKAINLLELILKTNCEKAIRKPDEFRPYCPEQLCKSGSLYMIDQIDGQKISIDPDILTTGLGVIGPQGGGKTCWLRHFCKSLLICNPDTKITIIDPKGAFSNMQGFSHIELSEACFDFKPPAKTDGLLNLI